MIAQYKNLSKRDYLWKMFEVIDCMQVNKENTTTPREKQLMIEFLCLPKEYSYFMFSSQSKKYIKKEFEKRYNLVWTNQNLNNKIYSLIKKGLLFRDSEDQIQFKPYISGSSKKIEKNLSEGKHFDLIFRFKTTEDGIDRFRSSCRDSG